MTKFIIRQPAGENTRFHRTAFDKQVNKEIRVNMPNGDSTMAKLIFADVAADGTFVELGFETDDSGDVITGLIESHNHHKETNNNA